MAEDFNINQIFNEYKHRVYRLLLSITRNEKDAEDAMQNTFLKIFKNLKYFKNKSRLSTWIYKIAYNEGLMSLRKRRSQFRLSGNLKASRDTGTSGLFVNWARLPDEQLLDKELKERIDNAVRHMAIQYRLALLLNEVEGFSLKESAAVLGLKINSLKTRLHRARMIIKSDVTDYFRDRQIEKEERKNKSCGIWTDFISSYAHGSLNKDKSIAFRKHIKDCPSCNLFLDAYLKAIDITGALECRDLPDELKDKIQGFVLRNHIKKIEPFSPVLASKQ